MNLDSIIAVVQDIFRDVLDAETLTIDENSSAENIDNWDSLSHISIITSIEKRYQIRFTLSELDAFNNVGDLIALIEKKLIQAGIPL